MKQTRHTSTRIGRTVVILAGIIAPLFLHISPSGASVPTLEDIRRLNSLNRFGDAEASSRVVLADLEARGLADSLETAEVLDQLANALRQSGKSGDPEARSVCERAIRIKEHTIGLRDPRYAASLHNLGLLLYRRGALDSAETTLTRALRIREDSLGPDDPDVAWSLIAVGATRTDRGDFASTREMLERAVDIQAGALSPGDPERAIGLLALGSLDFETGALSDALALFEEAASVCERSAKPDGPLLGSCYQNLGAVLSEIGDREGARRTFEKALRVREESLGADHPIVASTLFNLGDEALYAGDIAVARGYLRRALQILERAYGPVQPKTGWALMKLGLVELAAGDLAQARKLLARALETQEKTLGVSHPDLWQTLLGLAGVSRAEGEYQAADRYYRRTVELLEGAYGPSNIDLASSLSEYASFLLQAGDSASALENSLRASRMNGEQLQLISRGLAERQALLYAGKLASSLDVALAVLSGDSYRHDPGAIREVWDSLVRWRAVVLDEVASRNRTVNAAEGLAEKARRLEAARQRLANILVRGPRGDSPERYRTLTKSAREEMERAERDLGVLSAAFRSAAVRTRVGIHEVLSAVPSGTALVAYCSYGTPKGRYSLAFVLTRDREPALVPLGPTAEIDASVNAWTALVAAGPGTPHGGDGTAEGDCRTAGAGLRSKIWDPLAPYLEGTRRVFVVPDGSLNLVNLYALPVGTTGYVIESGPIIHYLSAERDLAWSDGGKESGSGLLALGGAAFDSRVEPSPYDSSAVARRAESGGPAAEGSAYRGAPPDCVNFRSAHFEPLPESVKEVADIAAAWSGPGNARVLTGASATEHAFKLLAPGRRVLHLATHGFFLNGNCEASSLPEAMRSRGIGGLSAGGAGPAARPGSASAGRVDEDNPLLLSGVALAGANRRDSARPDEEDGILTAEEIASLDLSRVEWAVLSACDTGVGEIQVGEGVLGLRRAFEAAGVSTLIMSLWPVEDRSAREWMKILYQAKFRKKLETDEAVREASLGVLRARRAQRAGSHPFYWAAFVAAGDWR